ncbi:hypothetical protein PILCRDRAFT_826804 [Piloderma croceum F 1598]|uniref:Uncharacterized protein n=1 Tax=Piloderma croceum (strain F 1598) TaxID=765440 RepID=A0A0C3ETV8_PILCF|nr:hypothetical protein PILCRDRAFT_826804 [Piloderma croceum F 1598]
MIDGSMYPDGWYPCHDWMKRDYSEHADSATSEVLSHRFWYLSSPQPGRHLST